MYCPKCATLVVDDQTFCRSCGLNLKLICEIVGDPSSADRFGLVPRGDERSRTQKKKLEIWGVIIVILSLLIGCLIPIFIGLGIANLNAVILLLAGLAGLVFFAGAIVLIYKDMPLKESAVEKSSPQTKFSAAKRHQELPSADSFEPLSSITEHTTDRLDGGKFKIRRKDSF